LVAFTIAAGGEPRINRVELRNSVLVISDADSRAAGYVDVTRHGLTMGTAAIFAAAALMPTRAVCRDLFLQCGDTVDAIAGPTFDMR
jgi:hypothetical protein